MDITSNPAGTSRDVRAPIYRNPPKSEEERHEVVDARLAEICVGMEVTSYESAEIDPFN